MGELLTHLSFRLKSNRVIQISEIAFVFLVAAIIMAVFEPLAGDDPIRVQAVIWLANVGMLVIVWFGLYLRGQSWKDFGMQKPENGKRVLKLFLQSLLVFALAMTGFVVGSIIMANITGVPDGATMGGYDYLRNNPLMLVVTLLGVYIVSSFGEEVIYRAFLINRIMEMGLHGKTAQVVAVLISSLIFGLVHYKWGVFGIVQTACMGLALGICYLWLGRNLLALIVAHGYMDTLLMVQMYMASN